MPQSELWVDPVRQLAGRGGRVVRLTPAEAAILAVFVEEPARLLGRSTLARRAGLSGAPRRCDAVLARLRGRLGDDLFATVRRRGWVLAVPVAATACEGLESSP